MTAIRRRHKQSFTASLDRSAHKYCHNRAHQFQSADHFDHFDPRPITGTLTPTLLLFITVFECLMTFVFTARRYASAV